MKKLLGVLAIMLMFASCTDVEKPYDDAKSEIESTDQKGGNNSGTNPPPPPPCPEC